MDGLRGVIRVVAPVAFGQSLLVEIAADFLKMHPYLKIDWRLRDAIIRFAEEGCDCWIKVGDVPDDKLIVRQLGRVERLVVGHAKLVETRRGVELENMPWVTLGPFEGNRIELFDAQGKADGFTVNPSIASDNIFAVREAVRRGVGVAILPKWLVKWEL